MYAEAAAAFRDEEVTVHSFDTWSQLSTIDGNTLSAPQGMHDDKATSFCLAIVARNRLCGFATIAPEHAYKRLPAESKRVRGLITCAPAGTFIEPRREPNP